MLSQQLTRRVEEFRGMPQSLLDERIKGIFARMRCDGAKDLSDEEIKRTLSGCCGPVYCVSLAIVARERGMTL